MLLTCMNKEKKVREMITFLPFLSLVSAVSGRRGTRGQKLWKKVILFITSTDKKRCFCALKLFFGDK